MNLFSPCSRLVNELAQFLDWMLCDTLFCAMKMQIFAVSPLQFQLASRYLRDDVGQVGAFRLRALRGSSLMRGGGKHGRVNKYSIDLAEIVEPHLSLWQGPKLVRDGSIIGE